MRGGGKSRLEARAFLQSGDERGASLLAHHHAKIAREQRIAKRALGCHMLNFRDETETRFCIDRGRELDVDLGFGVDQFRRSGAPGTEWAAPAFEVKLNRHQAGGVLRSERSFLNRDAFAATGRAIELRTENCSDVLL